MQYKSYYSNSCYPYPPYTTNRYGVYNTYTNFMIADTDNLKVAKYIFGHLRPRKNGNILLVDFYTGELIKTLENGKVL